MGHFDHRDGIDLAALRRARRARALEAMTAAGVDALVLTKSATVEYATGIAGRRGEASLDGGETAAAVLRRDGRAYAFVGDADAVPPAAEIVSLCPPVSFDVAASILRFAGACRESAGPAARVGVDRLSAPFAGALEAAFAGAEIVDADQVLWPARMRKTPEEIACLRRAQSLNEAAMATVVRRIVPGVREAELTGAFMAEMARLGVTACHVEPVWCALPRRATAAPWTFPGACPYRELTGQRRLGEGDLVVIDTGILYEGYMSDFGRTWYCTGCDARPSPAERDLFRRWREAAAAVTEACRPGASAADLRRAARRAAGGDPWPVPLYLAHGIGLGGVEPPFVGTDLGEAAEEEMLLAPDMVLVIEPYVWREGVGGYRAEESLLVTTGGCEVLSAFPYGALGDAREPA
jgi:Xaa-Pro aminopeptidase